MPVLLLALSTSLRAQDSVVVRDTIQRLRLDITGGYGLRLVDEKLRTPTDLGYEDGGYSGMARLSWKPQYMIALGIESGVMPISRIKADTGQGGTGGAFGTLHIAAVPIFFVVSMERYGFELSGGIGAYSLNSTGGLLRGGNVASQAWDIGYMGALAWTWSPERFPFGIGVDVRLMQFTDRPITILMPGLRLRWNIRTW